MDTSRASLREHGRYILFDIFYFMLLCCIFCKCLSMRRRSKTMLSLVEYTRPSSPNFERKAKEAEDVKKIEHDEDDELIVLRRKISLLNAQQAKQARDSLEAIEKKD